MILIVEDCDVLFKVFGCVFFKQDLDVMYEVVIEDFVYLILIGDMLCQMIFCV